MPARTYVATHFMICERPTEGKKGAGLQDGRAKRTGRSSHDTRLRFHACRRTIDMNAGPRERAPHWLAVLRCRWTGRSILMRPTGSIVSPPLFLGCVGGRETHLGSRWIEERSPIGAQQTRRRVGGTVLFNPGWGWLRCGDPILGCANATPSFDLARRSRPVDLVDILN